jgi:predicted ATPase
MRRHYAADGRHGSGGEIGKGICFETRLGARIRARQASDGAILFLAFLALAYVPTPPTLLLIEEPENGIYPKRLGELIKLLKDLAHRADGVQLPQIIISTHSPYVVSFFEPEEVTFLGRPLHDADAPVRARPLRDAPHIRDRLAGGEFYLGELWYNLTEEELFGDS